MSITSEITRLSNAKVDILNAINNKGVEIPDNIKLDGIATLINKIQTGTSGMSMGTFSQTVLSGSITIEHNLGTIPKTLLVWTVPYKSTTSNVFAGVFCSKIDGDKYDTHAYIKADSGKDYYIPTTLPNDVIITDTTFTLPIIKNNPILSADTFFWMVLGDPIKVRYYNDTVLLETVDNVKYGTTVTYAGTTPVKQGVTDTSKWAFRNWSPSPAVILHNTDCYAQFDYDGINQTIDDSWDEIVKSCSDGTYKTKYKIHDTKLIECGSDGPIAMEIVGIDKDELASGGKAPLTFITYQLLNILHPMNATNTCKDGFSVSDYYKYLQNTLKPLLPSVVRNNLKSVTKYTQICNTAITALINNSKSTETLWIPSRQEMFGNNAGESSGVYYSEAFPDNASRAKKHVTGVSGSTIYYLRSNPTLYTYATVGGGGASSSDGPTQNYGSIFGFCL